MKDLHTLDKYCMKDHEILSYGTVGNGGNGCFKVYIGGKSIFRYRIQWRRVGSCERITRKPAETYLPDLGGDVRNQGHILLPGGVCRTVSPTSEPVCQQL